MPRSSKPARPVIGDFIAVTFWDHAENFHDGMLFEVVGRLKAVTPKAYIIESWYYHDETQRAADHHADQNETKFAIVKKAIEKVKVLK